MKTTIYYYTTQTGDNPPKQFIESLPAKQERKIARIIAYIEEYGLITAIPHVKRLTDTPLWEIRILGQDNIRGTLRYRALKLYFDTTWLY